MQEDLRNFTHTLIKLKERLAQKHIQEEFWNEFHKIHLVKCMIVDAFFHKTLA